MNQKSFDQKELELLIRALRYKIRTDKERLVRFGYSEEEEAEQLYEQNMLLSKLMFLIEK